MKKILAVLLTLVMAFTFTAPAFAAVDLDFNEVNGVVGDVKDEACDAIGAAKDVYDNVQAEDNLGTVNSLLAFVEKLANAIHTLVHNLAKMFGFDCPFGPMTREADPSNLADVLAEAEEGDIVALTEGDYGVITLGTLNGVTLSAEEGVVVDKFVTTAETAVTDVTLKGFDFEIGSTNRDSGLAVDAAAVIDNLLIEDSTFTGSGYKSTCGIYGNNTAATLTVRNCSFSDMGYAFWTVSKGGYAALTIEGCTFTNLNSWVVLVQYGFLGDLTIDGCSFTTCVDGISKNGTFAADKTFTFTNNVVAADCAGHDGNDSKWFDIKTANAVVTGNTLADAEWVPAAEQGIKAL